MSRLMSWLATTDPKVLVTPRILIAYLSSNGNSPFPLLPARGSAPGGYSQFYFNIAVR